MCSFFHQLFWEKKLSGLNAFDIAEELVKTMELPKGLQGKNVQQQYCVLKAYWRDVLIRFVFGHETRQKCTLSLHTKVSV